MSKVFIAFDLLEVQHRARRPAHLRNRLKVKAALCRPRSLIDIWRYPVGSEIWPPALATYCGALLSVRWSLPSSQSGHSCAALAGQDYYTPRGHCPSPAAIYLFRSAIGPRPSSLPPPRSLWSPTECWSGGLPGGSGIAFWVSPAAASCMRRRQSYVLHLTSAILEEAIAVAPLQTQVRRPTEARVPKDRSQVSAAFCRQQTVGCAHRTAASFELPSKNA